MAKKHTFVWDGRGERGEDARFSIMAGRTATDLRLTLVHFRVLSHLGRFNHKKGWCRLSQAGLAEMFGVGRQAINAAVRELVDWHYIEKQSQAESGESFCLYRIVIDRDEEGGVSCTGDTPPGGGVSSTGDTPQGGECRVQATPVSAVGDTRVALEATPPQSPVKTTRARIDHIDHVDPRPPTPQARKRARGERGRDNLNSPQEVGHLLASLRTKAEWAAAVAHLIEPVLRQRQIDAPDPAYVIAEIAKWAAEAALPETLLRAAAHRLLEARKVTVRSEHFVEAVRAVQGSIGVALTVDRPGAAAVEPDGLTTISVRKHPGAFAAWLAHYRERKDRKVELMERHGFVRVPTMHPPTHQATEVRP